MVARSSFVEVKNEFVMTVADYRMLLWLNLRRSLCLMTLASAFIVGSMVLSMFAGHLDPVDYFMDGLVCGMIFALVILYVAHFLQSIIKYKKSPLSMHKGTILFAEKSVSVSTSNYYHVDYSWPLFTRWVETKQILKLSMSTGQSLLLMKQKFSKKDLARIREILSEKIQSR